MLEDMGNLGDFIGGIAVVATLVYLALQVRHGRSAMEANTAALEENRKLSLAQAYQQRLDHAAANVNSWRESEHVALYVGLVEPTSAEDRVRLNYYLRQMMNFCDNLEMQHSLGYIPDDLYEPQINEMVQLFGQRWRDQGIKEHRPSFRATVDSILENLTAE